MGKSKKRKGKIRIKQSARLQKNNSGLVGIYSPIKPIKNNCGIIRVKLKQKA